jgi:sporulation protein YlmC with PRC-barrel domain
MRIAACAVAALFVAGMAAGAPAADQGQPQQGQQQQMGQQESELSKGLQPGTAKASDVIGQDLDNQQGERLGKITDLLLDGKGSKVQFVVFDANTSTIQKIEGTGHYLIIPQENVSYANGKFTANLKREQLVQVPGFAADAWPVMDRQYQDKVRSYYRQASSSGGQPQDQQQEASPKPDKTAGRDAVVLGDLIRASTFIGKEVRNEQNERLGKVNDVVVKLDSGQISYAVLASGGVLGIGDKLFAIPLQAFIPPKGGDQVVLVAPKDRVAKAPGFDKDHWPTAANQYWRQSSGG